MRLIVRALEEAGRVGRVFSLCDTPADDTLVSWEKRLQTPIHAAEQQKWRLALQTLWRSNPQAPLVVGHLGLAPLALLSKLLGQVEHYVVVLHGIEAWEPLQGLDALALRRADGIIATTSFTRDRVAECNDLPRDRMKVLPLALEANRFDDVPPVKKRGDAHEELRVLSVARLAANEQYKGVDHTIEAIAELLDADIDVSYQVVGEGDDLERLQQLATRLGVDDHVTFLGRVSDETLAREFCRADVFALPSSGEGFGLVYLEAMHYGLPIIACAEGGAQFVVGDSENGLLVEYGSPASIAAALRQLREPSLHNRLSTQARHDVEHQFSFRRFKSDFLSIVDSVACVE